MKINEKLLIFYLAKNKFPTVSLSFNEVVCDLI